MTVQNLANSRKQFAITPKVWKSNMWFVNDIERMLAWNKKIEQNMI